MAELQAAISVVSRQSSDRIDLAMKVSRDARIAEQNDSHRSWPRVIVPLRRPQALIVTKDAPPVNDWAGVIVINFIELSDRPGVLVRSSNRREITPIVACGPAIGRETAWTAL